MLQNLTREKKLGEGPMGAKNDSKKEKISLIEGHETETKRPQEQDKAMRTRQGPEKGIAVGDFSTGLQTAAGLLAAAQGQHKARQGWPKTKSSKKKFLENENT